LQQSKFPWDRLVEGHAMRITVRICVLIGPAIFSYVPIVAAQSSQVAAEWALYNQIMLIGIIVGLVVFGLLFYAIIKYREKPQKEAAK
jgi:heme/copper-type cytochrome/quinol oxidase subunit 2